MGLSRFDRWTKSLTFTASRRQALLALVIGVPGLAASKNKKRKHNKDKNNTRKIRRNSFGCVNVGGFCKNGGQCCSGICQGQKGKKTCRAHDTGSCQADQDTCLSGTVLCDRTGGQGICFRTTGNASYCAGIEVGNCFACATDADCQPFCGEGAACVACAECEETGGTACVGLESCVLPVASSRGMP